ncbi:MAG: hypothetical protein L0K32_01795, partial [Lacticaseibacillus paracasei]|nr:hypothetical protein [Lacticaseibacillus paracasei]
LWLDSHKLFFVASIKSHSQLICKLPRKNSIFHLLFSTTCQAFCTTYRLSQDTWRNRRYAKANKSKAGDINGHS